MSEKLNWAQKAANTIKARDGGSAGAAAYFNHVRQQATTTAADTNVRSCGCIGPQYPDPVCPCLMPAYREREQDRIDAQKWREHVARPTKDNANG